MKLLIGDVPSDALAEITPRASVPLVLSVGDRTEVDETVVVTNPVNVVYLELYRLARLPEPRHAVGLEHLPTRPKPYVARTRPTAGPIASGHTHARLDLVREKSGVRVVVDHVENVGGDR